MHRAEVPSSSAYAAHDNGLGDQVKRERIMSICMGEAIKTSAISTVAAAAATLALTYRFKNFNRFTSLSIKVAIPSMAMLGSFSYAYESTMSEALIHPERFGLTDEVMASGKVTRIPVHHRALNYIYDHPFHMVTALGIPLAGTIFSQQMKNTHLTLSQKVMHSRVFAQGGVLSILLVTMAFREYMDRHGRFPEPDDEE